MYINITRKGYACNIQLLDLFSKTLYLWVDCKEEKHTNTKIKL